MTLVPLYTQSNPFEEWREEAPCLGSDLDFLNLEEPAHVTELKEVCSTCPVKQECLDFALGFSLAYKYGIWGGTTPSERRTMKRKWRERGMKGRPRAK